MGEPPDGEGCWAREPAAGRKRIEASVRYNDFIGTSTGPW
jgi:hypothetical protein